MLKQFHLLITGNVIGVGFRAWTKIQAESLGVTGWVKNTGNQVEVVIQGEKEKLKKMLNRLKEGPKTAKVEKIKIIKQEEVKEIFNNFEIRF